MTSESYTSPFTFGTNDDETEDYSTEAGDKPSLDKTGNDERRRRPGCGHPYRMRLNMSDENKQTKGFQGNQEKNRAGESQDWQPRHIYLRGARAKGRQSQQYAKRNNRNPHREERTYQPSRQDQGPKLSESTAQGNTSFDRKNHDNSHGKSNLSHKPRNLFPYQRSRRVRSGNTDYDSHQQNQYKPMATRESELMSNARQEQMNQPEDKSECFFRNLGSRFIENTKAYGTKVFYKKKRSATLPSNINLQEQESE